MFKKLASHFQTPSATAAPAAREFDWTRSRPHVALLARFRRPASPPPPDDRRWSEVLGEPVQNAVARLTSIGAIEQPSLEERLDIALTVPAIKALLKTRGLKVSGKKPELIERLATTDAEGASAHIAASPVFRCAETHRALAEAYDESERHDLDRAEFEVEAALNRDDFRGAAIHVAG